MYLTSSMKQELLTSLKANQQFLLLILVLIIFNSAPASSENNDEQEKYQENLASSFTLLMPDVPREGTAEVANKLRWRYQQLDSAIPALSPSQKAWIKEEQRQIFDKAKYKRLKMIADTKEWRLLIAKNAAAETKMALEELSSDKLQSEQRRIFLWTIVASHMMNRTTSTALFALAQKDDLYDVRLVAGPGQSGTATAEDAIETNHMLGWHIFSSVVVPGFRQLEEDSGRSGRLQ